MDRFVELLKFNCGFDHRCYAVNEYVRDHIDELSLEALKLFSSKHSTFNCGGIGFINVVDSFINRRFSIDDVTIKNIMYMVDKCCIPEITHEMYLRKIKSVYNYDFSGCIKIFNFDSRTFNIFCFLVGERTIFEREESILDILEALTKYGFSWSFGPVLFKILEKRINFGCDAIKYIIKSGNRECLEYFMDYAGIIGVKCLEDACLTLDEGMILEVLKFGMPVSGKCFENVISKAIKNNRGTAAVNARDIARIIDVLVEHGFRVTYKDVELSLNNKCYINNVERFGINFDSGLVKICAKNSYYPYPGILKTTIDALREECHKAGNLGTIRTLIGSGLKPDIVCLENACGVAGNGFVVGELMKF